MNRRSLFAGAALWLAGCNKPTTTEGPNGSAKGVTDPNAPVRTAPNAPKDEVEFAYALEIPDESGAPITVQDTFKFRTGERFRLQWKANFAAFLYVFNRGPKSANYVRLFPALEQASLVGASLDAPARIPKGATDWMRFDKVPGDEQMILIVSRAQVPALEQAHTVYSAEQFDRILIALERSRRPRSFRRFDEGHWHKCIAAGSLTDLAIVNRLPLYHE